MAEPNRSRPSRKPGLLPSLVTGPAESRSKHEAAAAVCEPALGPLPGPGRAGSQTTVAPSIITGVIAELANDIAWDAVGAQIEPYLRQHA